VCACWLESGGESDINDKEKKGLLVLVEPDLSVRDALVYLLEGRGWRVRTVEDCPSLLAAITGDRPLAVISESSLPDCTPQEILQQCRQNAVPVVFTGHDLPLQGAVDLIRQGAADFLDKPFPQSRLLDLLERIAKGQND
jgi:two-component system response regulator FixJ